MPISLRAAAALAVLLAVPVRAEFVRHPPGTRIVPGEYIVLGGPEKGLAGIDAEVVRELPLRNFPAGRVLRMAPEAAELAARAGFTVIPDFLVPFLAEPPIRVQDRAPWHLDRIDQRSFPLDSAYRYSYTGRNVRVYVMDSGILPNPDIAARLAPGADFVGDGGGVHASCGMEGTHGTGVTSKLAGAKYGVAKGVTVVPVRAGGCDNFLRGSAILPGFDWILSDARKYPGFRAVVNMSFGAEGAPAGYDTYFKKLDAAGILLIAGAGNSNKNACVFSPAGSKYVIAAGGTDKTDRRWEGSNWGPCVALFAPAKDVPSAGGADDAQWAGTGTSGAAPQVAGHVAQLLEQFPQASPALVRKLLVSKATPGLLGNLGKGSPNLLLHVGAFREAFSTFLPQWARGQKRFTLKLAVSVLGGGGISCGAGEPLSRPGQERALPGAAVRLRRPRPRRGDSHGTRLEGGSGVRLRGDEPGDGGPGAGTGVLAARSHSHLWKPSHRLRPLRRPT